MMDPSETNSFEEQWKKAFDEASVPPPQSAWERIEARLDQEEDNIIPLPIWWRTPRLWYMAASIAALLMVGGGIWYNRTAFDQTEDVASKSDTYKSDAVKQGADKAEVLNDKDPGKETTIAKAKSGDSGTQVGVNGAESDQLAAIVAPESRHTGAGNLKQGNFRNRKAERASGEIDNGASAVAATRSGETLVPNDQVASSKTTEAVSENLREKVADQSVITPQMLASRPYGDLDVHTQKRYVFFGRKIDEDKPVAKKAKEYFAGVGLMPASFNPDVKIKTAPLAFSTQSIAKQKSTTGTSEPGASYAIQTQGGVRVSKHWSVEAGLGYLKGNSSYQGGGYLLNAATSLSVNALQSALSSVNSPAADYTTGKSSIAAGVSNSLYIDINKQVRNDYQYLQVPVQAGYTLNPNGKLSYSFLGGMMANFFLSNELESAGGEIITTRAQDDVYRNINWAATTGLRFNYRLSRQWKATLTGSYQKAISSGFKENMSLEAHPYMYGVSWGVRYSF